MFGDKASRKKATKRSREILRSGGGARQIGSSDDLAPTHAESHRLDHKTEVELRQSIGNVSVKLMVGQVIVADLVFIVYAWVGRGWDIPSEVIGGWLAATVVQVIGVAAIVTRSLFPADRQRDFKDTTERNRALAQQAPQLGAENETLLRHLQAKHLAAAQADLAGIPAGINAATWLSLPVRLREQLSDIQRNAGGSDNAPKPDDPPDTDDPEDPPGTPSHPRN